MGGANRVAIYCRLSQEDRKKFNDDDDSISIQNQKEMLLNYILKEGWELYNVFSDDDYSGMDSNRPAWNKMLKDAENGMFDIVLCKSQSRFTRDMEMAEKYINYKFNLWNIRFISLVDYVDTSIKGNKKQRQINGLVNQWYIEDTSESIKSVLQSRRIQGFHIGATSVFGYLKDPKNRGKFIIDPIASKTVKKIFNLYESGYTSYKIAESLNQENVLTPSRYKKTYISNTYNHANMNSAWDDSVVRKILRNQMYIGDMVQGTTTKPDIKAKNTVMVSKDKWVIVENTHEPIISKEMYYNVQEILKKRGKGIINNGQRHLFSGRLICSECKHSMRRRKAGNGSIYFRCNNSIPPHNSCSSLHQIRYNDLEQLIISKIKEKIEFFCNFDKVEKNISAKYEEDEIECLRINENKIKDKITKKEESLTKLYEDKLDGIITLEEFMLLKANINKQVDMFKSELGKIKAEFLKAEQRQQNFKDNKVIIENYKNFEKLNFAVIDAFIESIEIGKKSIDKNQKQQIKINWKI